METLPLLGPDFGQAVIDGVRPQWAERQLQSNSEGGGEAAAGQGVLGEGAIDEHAPEQLETPVISGRVGAEIDQRGVAKLSA
jgi:hypothetical protein